MMSVVRVCHAEALVPRNGNKLFLLPLYMAEGSVTRQYLLPWPSHVAQWPTFLGHLCGPCLAGAHSFVVIVNLPPSKKCIVGAPFW